MGLVRASGGLTDDVLTVVPRAKSVRAYWRDAIDQLAGADPGLTQLRLALQAVLGIAVGVGLAYVFVKITGALQLPAHAAPSGVEAAADHALLIVALLISGMVAMLAGFQVTDHTARGQITASLWLPIPMLAAMTIGIALGPYRVASLIWLVVLLSAAVYVRRFGPRGVASGMVMFNGGFLGFFLHTELGRRDVGWLAALLGVGILASLAVRFTLFRPSLTRTLHRMRRSWEVRANRLLALSLGALEAADPRTAVEMLKRQQVRLNECTLMIDAQLAASVPDAAHVEAQRLFDADLSLSNLARFAGVLAERCADADLRALARSCITAVLRDDRDEVETHVDRLRAASCDDPKMTVVAHRLGATARAYMQARAQLGAAIERREGGESQPFTPAVTLNSGWLPGSAPVSTDASTTPGRGGALDRVALQPYNRATIQVAVAGTIAILVGDAVSGQRLYWAVLATFLAFMATTNSGEQIRKAVFRAGGTAVGIVVGDLLVHLTGRVVWSSLIIVLISLFFGIYLIRVSYMFMVIGITVTMSQLYAQLGEFSWHLLVLRLGETVIGVGAVVVTVLFVVPLRPQRVLTAGVLRWFRSLEVLVTHALDELADAPKDPLRVEVRDLDAAYAALESAAANLRQSTFGRHSAQLIEVRSVTAAARNYARSLAVGVVAVELAPNAALTGAIAQIGESMRAIEDRLETGRHATYVRSASLVDVAAVEMRVEGTRAQLVLQDLTLLDGTLARLAGALQMTIADHDTIAEPEPAPVP